mmetsp:Transcript_9343/g.16292  ORF Transcript_9343/g.16292 Transcript_9343/m.16292 type:complete len:355 (-) Transcript_9343:169-1233(-)
MTKDGSKKLVLVTGASGFVAKHTIDRLLREGYKVRGTVRNEEEAKIANQAFTQALPSSLFSEETFSLVTADLMSDSGWKEAVQGCDYVIHIASPYPLKPPQDRHALVPVARDGSLRVVRAALEEPTVERIVLTSSVMAMAYWRDFPKPERHITEDCWTDPTWDQVTAYPVSKTMAEKAVWDLVEKQEGAKDKLVVVNPMMVWGPMYDSVISTSSEIGYLFLTGAYPAVPQMSLTIVDVRDVAQLMERALVAPNVTGRRLIAASSGSLSMLDIGRTLGKAFPKYANKVPRYTLPNWLIRLGAYFDPALKLGLIDLGCRYEADSTYVTELTGVTFRPASEAIQAMGQSLIDKGIVN